MLVWLCATTRERSLLRATKAAEPFVEFDDTMNESRTVRDFLDSSNAAHHPDYYEYRKQSVALLNRINRCRAMLAAVAPPEVVTELAAIENKGGLYPGNDESRTALTDVAHIIRSGVRAGKADQSSLDTLLFGRLQDHNGRTRSRTECG